MKHHKYPIVFLGSLLFIAASCKKTDGDDPDAGQVEILRTAPMAAQVYHRGDTVKMNAIITAPFELHGYELTIINENTGTVVYDEDEHIHDDHFTLASAWADTLVAATPLKVLLTVELDHNGHSKSDSVMVQSQP